MNDIFVEVLNHLDKLDLVHMTQLNKDLRQYFIKQPLWLSKCKSYIIKDLLVYVYERNHYNTYCKYLNMEEKLTRWKEDIYYDGTIDELYHCKEYEEQGMKVIIPKDLCLPNLEILSLCFCGITEIPKTIYLPNLKVLYLSHNNIDCIPYGLHLPKLKVLDLIGNNIHSIPDNFKYYNSLEDLYLDSNPVSERKDYKYCIQGMELELVEDGLMELFKRKKQK